MTTLFIILSLVQLIIAFFLLLPVITVVTSRFTKKTTTKEIDNDISDFAVIITAYNDLSPAFPLVESLLDQKYQNFKIYLVADNCEKVEENSNKRVKVLVPTEPLNSKVASIDYAVDNFDRPHENLVIFDADNLAHPNFLKEINKYFQQGYKAVQGIRVAKNLNTKYAGLDALGEQFYNTVDRQLPFKIGSSSTLAGSGMAFNTQLYKNIMYGRKVLGGFDKILQGEINNRGYVIAFADKAITYDEKVSTANELKNQRTRWLHAYFRFAPYGFFSLVKGIKVFNFNQFYFGLNHMRPPLFILVMLAIIFLLQNTLFNPLWSVLWLGVLLLFTINFLYVIKINNSDKQIWSSLILIPKFIISQLLSIINIKTATKKFILTNHTQHISIDQIKNKA